MEEKVVLADGTEIEIPGPGFLDRLTRVDDLLTVNIKMMARQMNGLVVAAPLSSEMTAKSAKEALELQQKLETLQVVPYQFAGGPNGIDLTTALTDQEYIISGTQITAATDGVLDGVTIKLNNKSNQSIPLKYFNPMYMPISKIYLTSTAQPGKTLWLTVTRDIAMAGGGNISADFSNKLTLLAATTTNLLAGATYTMTGVDVQQYGAISVSVFADQNGTLYVDQSADGTNYDIIESSAYVANGRPGYITNVYCPVIRTRFTNNGAGPTTALRIYTLGRRV